MKALKMFRLGILLTSLCSVILPGIVKAQDKTVEESNEAKSKFIKADPSIANLFKTSYGYAILPNVGKGAVGLGGAAGKGTVYEKGKAVGRVEMIQATIGAQAGGQAYREVIFFENKDAFDRFTGNKIEFDAQTTAVAVKSGASANANYRKGVVVFTQEKGGLMLEASLGGQKFTYHPLK